MESRPEFRRLTVDAFVERLASSAPVPGGGSASAIAASLGAALVTMVSSLSEGRPKLTAHAATHVEAAAVGRRLSDRFLALADEDAAAYAGFAAALRMPRETDEERSARSAAIHAAARLAAETPLACVEACLELVRAAEMLAGRSNPNAASDLSVAALLGEAAARGAAANVLVNLPSVGDEGLAEEMRSRVELLLLDVEALARSTYEEVRSGVARDPLPLPPAHGSHEQPNAVAAPASSSRERPGATPPR